METRAPRAGLFAEVAADAELLHDDAGARLFVHADGALRARIGAGHRMRTLAAGILHDKAVAPDAEGRREMIGARGPEHDVARHLDAREPWIRLAVVEFRAGKFAAVAGHAKVRVGNDEALGGLKNDVRAHAGLRLGFGHEGDCCGGRCRLEEASAREVMRQRQRQLLENVVDIHECLLG